MTLEEMDALWDMAKETEGFAPSGKTGSMDSKE
jgi:hypothetical protein